MNGNGIPADLVIQELNRVVETDFHPGRYRGFGVGENRAEMTNDKGEALFSEGAALFSEGGGPNSGICPFWVSPC